MVAPIALVRADRESRLRDLSILAVLAAWLVYTRLYFVLHSAHLTLPPCPFLYITGHPCPFCGGTRSYAYMWQGDLLQAARLYPLGPVLFPATLVAVGYALGALFSGRALMLRLPDRWEKLLYAGVGAVLAVSWALKLLWLGN